MSVHRPPMRIRSLFDLGYRIDGLGLTVFEVHAARNNSSQKIETDMARAEYDQTEEMDDLLHALPGNVGISMIHFQRSADWTNS